MNENEITRSSAESVRTLNEALYLLSLLALPLLALL